MSIFIDSEPSLTRETLDSSERDAVVQPRGLR